MGYKLLNQTEEELANANNRNAELTAAITELEAQKDELQTKLTDHLGVYCAA